MGPESLKVGRSEPSASSLYLLIGSGSGIACLLRHSELGHATMPEPGIFSQPDPGHITRPEPDTFYHPEPGCVTMPEPDALSQPEPECITMPEPGTVSQSRAWACTYDF